MSLNGLVVDPVCGMEFDEVNAAASVEWRGQTHWFCTDACKDDFERHTETNALGKKFDPKSKMTVTGITPEEAEAVASVRLEGLARRAEEGGRDDGDHAAVIAAAGRLNRLRCCPDPPSGRAARARFPDARDPRGA